MNYEFSQIYTINQDGKQLSSPDKIKINQISNKVEKFVFKFDGSIPSYLFLSILFTHQKKGYQVFEPVLFNPRTEEYYYIIGTSITKYPGLWSMTIVGTEQDYNETDYNTIDDTMFLYLSNPFKKITVLNSEIDPDTTELTYPNIDKQMYDFHALHDNVVELSMECAELEGQCELILADNKQVYEDTLELKTQCEDLLAQCQAVLQSTRTERTNLQNLYSSLSNQLRSEYQSYVDELNGRG